MTQFYRSLQLLFIDCASILVEHWGLCRFVTALKASSQLFTNYKKRPRPVMLI